ncbi:MAG: electron transfer flavoprotein subunit beta/FixA family protein [Cryobacterium sp.]|uniref:electron transfer flavoprotein subunit beta/FixA family protein n=1 Tax=unclassified Cryobacterium TaxID=2649013 RepID=UPI0018CA4F1E|nr:MULTISPECIES: electron transfer flavoprotein subunit beta/FixA family protein [unclassified Cryobacterium]MCY7405375.1 electron transfer flavoprotein subunit beta/FixA family protein [Cryobacterium sp.]MEC5152879.1 electron transfer flavoprotein beta subunit [Cryobacterium sp. CAN_C3]
MKIVVLVKEVPDTYAERRLNLETGLADREANDRVLDEIGERAVEVAVSYAESHPDTEVTVLTIGPQAVPTSLRKALAMGATSGFHVLDDALRGADLTLTAEALAKAAERIGFDLIIAGDVSTDGNAGVIPAMLAERLGIAHATALNSLEISETDIGGERETSGGTITLTASLPAIVSITERHPDARFPGFKGIMASKKKSIVTVDLADLNIDSDADLPRSIVVAVSARPARSAGLKIVDEGNAGQQLAEYLVQNRLV